jgi:hypothetical protein
MSENGKTGNWKSENRTAAGETITSVADKDGQWRVSGCYVK